MYRLRLCLICLCPLLTLATGAMGQQPIALGDDFPELTLPTPAAAAARTYLGIGAGATFSPSQIRAEVLLVELLNTHCFPCQRQAAIYNELYRLLQADPQTQGRVKLLGIAVANTADEVTEFTTQFAVPFPVVPDPGFDAWRAVGGNVTPFSIYVRQGAGGRPGVVAGTHRGLNPEYQKLRDELLRLTAVSRAQLRRQGQTAQRTRQAIAPLYTDAQLELKVRNAFIATGGTIAAFTPLDLSSGRRVYRAEMEQDGKRRPLFAEVVSRTSICAVCHDPHFIYLFDDSGKVVGFEPLYLTKQGNVDWTAREVTQLRRRLVGGQLRTSKAFDPKVDAVTSATITSAVIFDSLAQGKDLLQELERRGWR